MSKNGGWLELCGLTQLSDAAAESLSKHKGSLDLRSLTQLSEGAAECLNKHPWGLHVSVHKLPEAAATILRNHTTYAEDDDD